MNPNIITLPCTRDDIIGVIEQLWPQMTAARGVDGRSHAPIVDGHMDVGFSIRLFGPPARRPTDVTRAAYAALEDVLRALEDRGLEVTREGNKWQPGRLVLGWSAYRGAYNAKPVRLRDLPEDHGANAERRARLLHERARRDEGD